MGSLLFFAESGVPVSGRLFGTAAPEFSPGSAKTRLGCASRPDGREDRDGSAYSAVFAAVVTGLVLLVVNVSAVIAVVQGG
jgi:hypothetical protein